MTRREILTAIIAIVLFLSPALFAQEVASQGMVDAIRFTHSGAIDLCGHDAGTQCPTFWIDMSQDPSGATITSNSGHVLTKAGSPTRIANGTYPLGIDSAQGFAHDVSGAGSYWYRASDGTMNPSGDWSICAVFTFDLSGAYQYITSKGTGGGSTGWGFSSIGTDDLRMFLSDDGTNMSTITKSSCLSPHQTTFACFTYDYVGAANSVGNLYVDALAVETDSAMRGPVYASTAVFNIGAAGVNDSAKVHALWIYSGLVLTANDIATMQAQYRGLRTDSGNIITVTTANPPMVQIATPASGTEPFLVPMPVDTAQIGPWGIATPSARTSVVHYGDLNLCAAGDFTGWTEVETAGNGTAAITCETGTMAEGSTAAKITLTGTTSTSSLTSVCLTTGIGADLYVNAWLKGTAAVEESMIQIIEWDAGDCTSYLDSDILYNGNPGTSWDREGGLQAAADWHADTSSYQVRVQEDGDGGTSLYVDAVEAYPGSEARPGFCGSSTAASTVCTASVPQSPSVISADGNLTIRVTARSDWAGVDLAADKLFIVDGDGATNSISIEYDEKNNQPQVVMWDDSSEDIHTVVSGAAWAKDTDYSIVIQRDELASSARLLHDGAWQDTVQGWGSGHRTAAASTIHFGGSTGSDAYLRDVSIYRRAHEQSVSISPNAPVWIFTDAVGGTTHTVIVACPVASSLTVAWGDGTSDAVVCDGTNKTMTNIYAVGVYDVSLIGDYADITYLGVHSQASVSGDITNLSGMTSLTVLHMYNTSVSDRKSTLMNYSHRKHEHMYNTSVSGDIANLSGMTSLTNLHMGSTSVSGDIANLSGMTSLTYLYMYNTSVSGDISNLSGMTSLTVLYMYNTSVSGDIANLSGMTSLTYLRMYSIVGRGIVYTTTALPPWTGTDIQIYSSGLDAGEVDQFLIDFADGVGTGGKLYMAGDNGTRTAASDAAKATLLGTVPAWDLQVNE